MGMYGNTLEATAWGLGIQAGGVRVTGATFCVSFDSESNGWYRAEYNPTFLATWTNVAEGVSTSDVMQINLPMSGNRGFYRIFNFRP